MDELVDSAALQERIDLETEKVRRSMAESKALLEDDRSEGQFVMDAIDALKRLDGLVAEPTDENLAKTVDVIEKLKQEIDRLKRCVPSVADTVDQLDRWLEAMIKEKCYTIEKQTVEMHPIETDVFILDIGGGGRGIIGELNGRKVIAIDKSIKELEGAENDSLKVVMDATDLKFLPASFDVVTSFFTLIYIENDRHREVFNEVYNVLKEHGRFLIWDVTIPRRFEDKPFFMVPLEVMMPDGKVEAGYGIEWGRKEQDLEYFKRLATRAGFEAVGEWSKGEIFFLELIKHPPDATPNSG